MKRAVLLLVSIAFGAVDISFAQDTIKTQRFNFHFQQTVITQAKPSFTAAYSGDNSLQTKGESASSLTSTMYMGARLWKGAEAYFNPEISGGSGISRALGIAGFTNGEAFRIGSADPRIYIGRLYLTQNFNWGNEYEAVADDQNQLAGRKSKHYLQITAGKFGISDFFDGNTFSHDPRTQFMNWSLMSNGAWDYPANTRGYIIGLYAELGQPNWTLRYAYTMVPTQANGSILDERILKGNTQTLEYEQRYLLSGQKGALRVLGFYNRGKMGNYNEAVRVNPAAPDVDAVTRYGHRKWGFGLNAEQNLTPDLGVFARASYNDGHTETWFFTEIDRSISFGSVLKGNSWKRTNDEVGLAFAGNGISAPHRDYLGAGGYGFIIGDGKLNYAHELIAELYYKADVYQQKFWLTPDYQFIVNPAYNRDRGPVHVFSLRAHVEF